MGTRVRPLIAATLACAALLASPAASADVSSENRTMAQGLFDEARRLMQDGKYADACPKLAASQRLDPGVGTLLNLAVCYEKNGQTASAWSAFKDVAAAAREAGESKREQFARDRAAELEPQLAKLTVVVDAASVGVAGLTVARDGVSVPSAAWGVPIAVDPGAHAIEASAPGRRAWSGQVTVAARDAHATVTVPPLELLPPQAPHVTSPPPVAVPPSSATPPLAPPPSAEPASSWHPMKTWGIVSGATGIAALAASGVLAAVAKGTYSKSDAECVNDVCTNRGLDARRNASSQASAATGLFVGGAVLAAAGVVLYVAAPRGGAVQGVTVVPAVARGGAGAALEAAW